ncbi:FecR family protein [Pedobacter montanisoli]|uniref:FecR domain-containing protein n=1 Tax=Pedobacter montanisoli TaxID=2923277 RepID=A0ABS9ZRH5_9SPHI|nr:FecR domain-containing protein [Pedobacter montanisoli]MCJ0741191.1 FecR domain-containing protein [Pedobacter montanisoli]
MSIDKNWEMLLDYLESNQEKGNVLSNEELQRLAELRALVDETSDAFELYQSFNIEQKWIELRALGVSRGFTQPSPIVKQNTFKPWLRIAAAAAIVVMLFGAGLFYFNLNNKQKKHDQLAYKNDVSPGKLGATLTLANGKKIKLADAANGEIATDGGISMSKTADGQLVYLIKGSTESEHINTLSTAKGETYVLILPDKSKVWLNAASSLTYSTNLNERKTRRVKLEGEGYFEIAKDRSRPFVVESKGQEVEVLGTHFNINAYSDGPAIATTLLEGSVKVSLETNLSKIIKPGEQALNNDHGIDVVNVDVERITAWKDGGFALSGKNLKTAMREIARWYNVEVVYDPSISDELETGGWISRSNKLSTVLKLIESSGQVRFKIEGKKVYVSK